MRLRIVLALSVAGAWLTGCIGDTDETAADPGGGGGAGSTRGEGDDASVSGPDSGGGAGSPVDAAPPDPDAAPPEPDAAPPAPDAAPPDPDAAPVVVGPLEVTPATVDFGEVGFPGCLEVTAPLDLTNQGTADTCVTGAELVGACAGFSVYDIPDDTPGGCLPIPAGATVQAPVAAFQPDVAGVADCTLVMPFEGGEARVPLSGSGVELPETEEVFVQGGGAVDVLLVIDGSGSMSEEQAVLANSIQALGAAALASGGAHNFGVVTMDMQLPAESGRLQGDPAVLDTSIPNLPDLLAQRVEVGTFGGDEEGFEAARAALQPPLSEAENGGFRRPGAALHVVFLSDEEDVSPDPVVDYAQFFLGIGAEGDVVQTHAIVGPAVGPANCNGPGGGGQPAPRYAALVAQVGGLFLDVCAPTYQGHMQQIADLAFPPLRQSFVVEADPASSTLEVKVDDEVLEAGWAYNAQTGAIDFETPPPAGSTVRVISRPPCPGE